MRSRRIAAAAAALALLAPGGAGAATPPPDADDQPLHAAGEAAAHVTFVGVLEVRWTEAGSQHRESLLVQGANGSVVVRGGTNVMASEQQRLVEHAGRWDLLSPVDTGADAADGGTKARPRPALKYQLNPSGGPLILNRATHLVEVRQAGVLLERLYLDEDTGLLLRREQFEGGGGVPSRTIEFETLTVVAGGAVLSPPTPSLPTPSLPTAVHNAAPKAISARRLPDGMTAPAVLATGYERLGIYQRGDTVQVVYSDGLYDLSVFQQPGRIDRHNIGGGTKVTFGTESATRYSWTGNHVLLWEEQGIVYTAVSDAPLNQVVAAVGSLPLQHASTAFVRRLRQVARALVQPFAA